MALAISTSCCWTTDSVRTLAPRRDEPADADTLEELPHATIDAAAVEDPAEAVGAVLVDEDVLGHAQVRDEGELLEDGGDAGDPGRVGVVEARRAARGR